MKSRVISSIFWKFSSIFSTFFWQKSVGKNYHVIFSDFFWSQLVAQVTMHPRKILLGTLFNPYWTIIGLFLWWCEKSSKWPKITYEADREIPTSGTRVFKGGEDDGKGLIAGSRPRFKHGDTLNLCLSYNDSFDYLKNYTFENYQTCAKNIKPFLCHLLYNHAIPHNAIKEVWANFVLLAVYRLLP